MYCSVLSQPWFEGWPHHGCTFSIYLCPLTFSAFWLTLPQRVLSTSWCCLSRPCVVFLVCMHLALFLALSLSSGNSLVSSWCDHSMLAYLLWLCHYLPTVILIVTLIIIGIPSPTHSLTLGLNPSFSANPPYPAFSFSPSGFTIWISHTVYCYLWAYPSFYFLLFLFLHIFSCRFRAVD